MDAVFLKLLNMSISAVWVVGIVLVLRLGLKRAPKWLHCTLWAMVAVRLICPISLESGLSLLPSSEVIPSEVVAAGDIQVHTGFEAVDNRINSGVLESYMEGVTVPVGHTDRVLTILGVVWLAGMALMVAYAAYSYIRLQRKVAVSVEMDPGVWICDYIQSPFILGILRPRIYLPSAMANEVVSSVLAHERAHIRRKDHWWKPLGFLLLTIHWFNPVIWIAYVLLCRDIEMACDEKVIRDMDAVEKKQYSQALLSCSLPRHLIAACPLAFGEVGVKERVKSVLHFKKPAFWVVLIAVTACVVVAVCFLTDPLGMTLANQWDIKDLEISSVVLTAGEQIAVFPEQADIDRVTTFLKEAKIESLPISQDRSEDRPKDFSIRLHNGYRELVFWFDSDFTDVWVGDGGKPSLSYRMVSSEEVHTFFEDMLMTDIPEAVSGGPDENGHYYFMATVLRITDKSILVEPMEGCWERRSSDKIWVSLIFESEELVPVIRVGDRIRVIYNGAIQETYPAQINWVYDISVEERRISDAMLQEITTALGKTEITLFDYQTVGSGSVLGCQYGNRYGVVYLNPDGTMTVLRQETMVGRDMDTDFVFDINRLSDGYISAIIAAPTVVTLCVESYNHVSDWECRLYNFPALVVVPAGEFGTSISCIHDNGDYQVLVTMR